MTQTRRRWLAPHGVTNPVHNVGAPSLPESHTSPKKEVEFLLTDIVWQLASVRRNRRLDLSFPEAVGLDRPGRRNERR
jgi:hypothetical protein